MRCRLQRPTRFQWRTAVKRFLAFLLLFLFLCASALAAASLEAPYTPDSPGAAVAAAAAEVLGLELHLTDGADLPKAADVMLLSPGALLCADQSLIISGLQGYTSQDLRTAMRPVCRLAVSPLYLVVNAQAAADLGITDAQSLLSYIAEHEYEAYFARHIDADVADRAVTKLSESVPVFTEGYPEDEIPSALESGEVLAAVVSEAQLAVADSSLLPLCSLGAERTAAFPDLPCAADLDIPPCDGIGIWLFASSDTDDAAVAQAASACQDMDPAAVNAVPGFVFAPLAGEEAEKEIRDIIADYIGYMTSEGLFFYEQ